MISAYIVYFNNESDVVPIAMCENYTDAEKNFESITRDFVKIYYADADRNLKASSPTAVEPFHPVKICKYEENVNSSVSLAIPLLKSDISFPAGLIFVRKRYDACVYEKFCYPGTVYNSYVVKYIGRIGVIHQELNSQTEVFQRLKDVSDAQEEKIRKLEMENKRLEAENKRLEYTNMCLESSRSGDHTGVPVAPSLSLEKTGKKFQPPGNVLGDFPSKLLEEINSKRNAGTLFVARKHPNRPATRSMSVQESELTKRFSSRASTTKLRKSRDYSLELNRIISEISSLADETEKAKID